MLVRAVVTLWDLKRVVSSWAIDDVCACVHTEVLSYTTHAVSWQLVQERQMEWEREAEYLFVTVLLAF